MKQKVENMEEKIKELIEDMDEICESSEVITDTLAPRRSEIEKLVGVRGLLKKLEFLFELPIRLNRCIELEAYVYSFGLLPYNTLRTHTLFRYAQAVKYFVTASDVLKQHLHVSSFKTILVEAETIIGKLKDDMKTKLKRVKLTSSRLTEYVRLLLQLGEPADQLQIQFLDWQKARLMNAMKECNKSIMKDEKKRSSTKSFVEEMNKVFVDEFVEVCRQHAVMFPRSRSLEFICKTHCGFLQVYICIVF